MKQRMIEMLIEPEATTDGAGVSMKRAIATRRLSDLDPFLLLDHFGSTNPDDYIAGFPMHPHRGIETVTYMLKGLIKHRDSSGNEGVISGGGIQWMTAGSGIMHEEMPAMNEGEMEGFQLWVNLPSRNKMMKPRYRDYEESEIPTIDREDGTRIKVIAGEVYGVKGAISDIEAAPNYIDVKLAPDTTFEHQISSDHNACAYLFEGSARFDEPTNASASDNEKESEQSPKLAVFGEGEYIRIRSSSDSARFLLISGMPLNEPIARYGPFVMNTREEIQQAIADLQDGTFVKSYE